MTVSKELSEVQQLIHMGKTRGYVTYEEMNNVLPTHLVNSEQLDDCLLYTSPSPRDVEESRMPSSA